MTFRGVATAALLALFGAVAGADPLVVRTDSYPIAYFAERIAGDAAEVVLPVPPDRDPALWAPSIAEIAAYQEADLILLNGAGLADWTTRVSLPRSRTVDTSADFAGALIETEGVIHSHGPEGEHSHAGVASLTWLDLELAMLQAKAVADALAALLPDETARLEENLEGLAADLAALDAEAREIGALAAGLPLLASHPSYQYLARYGFAIESVSWEPGATPGPEQLAELDALLSGHPATIMLWDAEVDPEVPEALAARGIVSVVFPTLVNRPTEGDFVTSLRNSLSQLRSAIGVR